MNEEDLRFVEVFSDTYKSLIEENLEDFFQEADRFYLNGFLVAFPDSASRYVYLVGGAHHVREYSYWIREDFLAIEEWRKESTMKLIAQKTLAEVPIAPHLLVRRTEITAPKREYRSVA